MRRCISYSVRLFRWIPCRWLSKINNAIRNNNWNLWIFGECGHRDRRRIQAGSLGPRRWKSWGQPFGRGPVRRYASSSCGRWCIHPFDVASSRATSQWGTQWLGLRQPDCPWSDWSTASESLSAFLASWLPPKPDCWQLQPGSPLTRIAGTSWWSRRCSCPRSQLSRCCWSYRRATRCRRLPLRPECLRLPWRSPHRTSWVQAHRWSRLPSRPPRVPVASVQSPERTCPRAGSEPARPVWGLSVWIPRSSWSRPRGRCALRWGWPFPAWLSRFRCGDKRIWRSGTFRRRRLLFARWTPVPRGSIASNRPEWWFRIRVRLRAPLIWSRRWPSAPLSPPPCTFALPASPPSAAGPLFRPLQAKSVPSSPSSLLPSRPLRGPPIPPRLCTYRQRPECARHGSPSLRFHSTKSTFWSSHPSNGKSP